MMNDHIPYPACDAAVLAAARQGDASALERLLRHYDPLIRFVPSWPKWNFPSSVQEDLRQSICAQIQKNLHALNSGASLESFIKSIGVHRCIDEVRCQIKLRKLSSAASQGKGEAAQGLDGEKKSLPEGLAVEHLDVSERAAALKRILESLEEPCGTIIRMFYFEGLSYEEMAECLCISSDTVGVRLGRCLNQLRMRLMDNNLFDEKSRITSNARERSV